MKFVVWRITDAEIGRDVCACINNRFFNATVTYMNLSVFFVSKTNSGCYKVFIPI